MTSFWYKNSCKKSNMGASAFTSTTCELPKSEEGELYWNIPSREKHCQIFIYSRPGKLFLRFNISEHKMFESVDFSAEKRWVSPPVYRTLLPVVGCYTQLDNVPENSSQFQVSSTAHAQGQLIMRKKCCTTTVVPEYIPPLPFIIA